MFNTSPIVKDDIGRVQYTDLQGDFGNWLAGRVQEKYPSVHRSMFLGIFRGYAESNEFLFLRSKSCCGMSSMTRQPLGQPPIVEDVFLFCRVAPGATGPSPDAVLEGIEIYRRMVQWAVDLGAGEYRFSRASDVPVMHFRDVAKITKRTVNTVVMGGDDAP